MACEIVEKVLPLEIIFHSHLSPNSASEQSWDRARPGPEAGSRVTYRSGRRRMRRSGGSDSHFGLVRKTQFIEEHRSFPQVSPQEPEDDASQKHKQETQWKG